MKVKLLSRAPEDYLRETKADIHKLPRNYDPAQHPFEAAREYQRAINAAKLERVFSKPFVGSLDGHGDGITAMATHPQRLAWMASGAADGEVRLWDLTGRRTVASLAEHSALVRGLAFTPDGSTLISAGDDKQLAFWRTDDEEAMQRVGARPIDVVASKDMVSGLTHHRSEAKFATCGENVVLWDTQAKFPVQTYSWGVDSIHAVSFNSVESNVLGACASDRSIILYDVREKSPMRKVVLELRSNAIAWNPMEAFIFTVANEDYNLYAFDLRKLCRPLNVHMDHTAAVVDVAYAPTGKEFVSGSYDKTVRIFKVESGHSREIYHTKRMQRLTCVAWSKDNKYVLSGSDEMNIRIWKARASEKIGILKERERSALDYSEKLKSKFGSHPQVSRIVRHRQVPKHVRNAAAEHRVIKESAKRKEANRRKHSKPGAVPHVPERLKHVVKEQE